MPNWTKKTTAEEAATALQSQIRGKNVLVTGVSPKSLGGETVRAIAPYAKTIILASRTPSKIEDTIKDLRTRYPTITFYTIILDLTSLAAIHTAAAEVLALDIPIHVIINNAAVTQNNALTRTKDGFELQFGANHLGHFVFNGLILSAVRRAAEGSPAFKPRIVAVSSEAHTFPNSTIRFDDPNFEKRPEEYEKMVAYGQSKTANILYTRLLSKKLAPEGILAYCLHPGGILETGLGSAVTIEELHSWGIVDKNGKPLKEDRFKTLEQGASTQVIAAFDPEIVNTSGSYLYDAVVADEKVAEWAKDDVSAEKLWALSEQLVNYRFAI